MRRTGVALALASVAFTGLASANHSGNWRWYALRTESAVGNYTAADIYRSHHSIGSIGSSATFQVHCSTNGIGEANFMNNDTWVLFGTTARFMELLDIYWCSSGVRRKEIAYAWSWDGPINTTIWQAFSDSSSHRYRIQHTNVTSTDWNWYYDATFVNYLRWGSHAPHAAWIDVGLEMNNPSASQLRAQHHRNWGGHYIVGEAGTWEDMKYDTSLREWPPAGLHFYSSTEHHLCVNLTQTCH